MPNQNEERYYAELLLSVMELIPDSLQVKDKPDIRLAIGGRRIGIEITEAAPEEYRRAKKTIRAKGWKGVLSTGNFQHRIERRTTAELEREGLDHDGPWSESSKVFDAWSLRIEERLKDKERAFLDRNFERFSENWLLIVDWEHSAITHEPDLRMAERFFQKLISTFRPPIFFGHTFILMSNAGLLDWDHDQNEINWKVTDRLNLKIC